MRRHFLRAMLCLASVVPVVSAPAQQVVDRIAARVEGDIILLSEVHALARYQQLVDEKSEPEIQILDRMIDQWIVRGEADAAQFPHPTDTEIQLGIERVQNAFSSPKEYADRCRQLGITAADVREMVASQLYLSNYLDSRFRPSAQVSDQDVEDFYEKAVIPRAKARGQMAPTLEASREVIQEALVQKSIGEQADRWLKESRPRYRVEKFLNEAAQ